MKGGWKTDPRGYIQTKYSGEYNARICDFRCFFFGVLTAGTFSRENMNQELGPVCIYLGACSSTFMLIKFFPVLIKKRERDPSIREKVQQKENWMNVQHKLAKNDCPNAICVVILDFFVKIEEQIDAWPIVTSPLYSTSTNLAVELIM